MRPMMIEAKTRAGSTSSRKTIVAQGTATIADPSKPLGSNVFILQSGDEDGFTWQASGFAAGKNGAKKPDTSTVERITPPPEGASRHRRPHGPGDGARHHRPAGECRNAHRKGLHHHGRGG
ncbi:MAG: hypothetical protein WBE08_06940 [Methyloceanibacter sp.]